MINQPTHQQAKKKQLTYITCNLRASHIFTPADVLLCPRPFDVALAQHDGDATPMVNDNDRDYSLILSCLIIYNLTQGLKI